MNRHPLIRQRAPESAKWTRRRKVRFQRPFPGSMGSAAVEANVSSFFVNLKWSGAPLWRQKKFWHPIETFAPESSPFDIAVMKPSGWFLAALLGFAASRNRFLLTYRAMKHANFHLE